MKNYLKKERCCKLGDNIELPIKSILSYSRIDLFRQCPMRYKLKYIERNYTDTTSLALELGTLSHYIFELKHTPNQKMSLDEIWDGFLNGFSTTKEVRNEDGDLVEKIERIKGYNELTDEYGFDIYTIDEKTGNCVDDRVAIMKDKFFNETIEDEWEVIGLEKDFEITFCNKAKIKGCIDRVDINKISGDIRVVDYKTNKKLFDKSKLSTPLQMYIYSLACYELYGKYPTECVYDMLFLNEKQIGGTKGFMNRGEKALNKVLDSLIYYQDIGKEYMPPKSSPLCFFCDFCINNPNSDDFYNGLCEYYSNWTRENKTFSVNKEWQEPQNDNSDWDW